MNLIEIVKGMPNAGEAINDNFNQLGFEVGKNDNGTFIKHASGLALAWNDNIRLTYNSNLTLRGSWDFPIELVGEKPLLLTTKDSYSGAPVIRDSSIGASVTGASGSYSGQFVLMIDGSFNASDTAKVSGFAIGFWKEIE